MIENFKMKNVIYYMINLLFLSAYIFIIYNMFSDIIESWKNLVDNFNCVGTHAFVYLHVFGFTNLIRIIEILFH